MDFLKIREKAKAKAAERDAAKAERPEPGAGAAGGPDAGAAGAPEDAGTPGADADVIEGELAARLQGLPPAEDARFTTWRPGTGAPPVLPEAPPRPPPEPRQEDFAVVSARGGGTAVVAAPLAPPPEEAQAAPRLPPADPLEEFFYREDEAGPDVPEVGGGAADAPVEAPDLAAREEYLTFLLGDEEYAVAIERVREVLKAPPLTEVPRAPRPVLGVVTVRGEVVAVFDPRVRLGLPAPGPTPESGRLVIVDAGEGPCALLVDAVASVVRLKPGSIEPRPQVIGGAAAECLSGIGRQGGRLFTVLDLAALLRRPGTTRASDEEERRVRS